MNLKAKRPVGAIVIGVIFVMIGVFEMIWLGGDAKWFIAAVFIVPGVLFIIQGIATRMSGDKNA
jgi:hypothetical protein